MVGQKMDANISAPKAKIVMVGSTNTLKFMSTKDPCDIPNDFKTDASMWENTLPTENSNFSFRSDEGNEDLKSKVESSEVINDNSQEVDLESSTSSDLDSDKDVDENETDVLMVGKNTLDLGIGNYIQRRHDLGENTRVNIRHQRSQIQGQPGIQAGENMYIYITVNSYPSVEKAVVQAYQHNEDFSSKLQRWFSDFLVILAGVDHGSIIIELKPESPEGIERMLNAIKDGSFDDVILDMLREKSVFELIKGKEVTVDVQLETRPAATESIASSKTDIQIRLKGKDCDSTVLDSTVQGCHSGTSEKKESDQHVITSPDVTESIASSKSEILFRLKDSTIRPFTATEGSTLWLRGRKRAKPDRLPKDHTTFWKQKKNKYEEYDVLESRPSYLRDDFEVFFGVTLFILVISFVCSAFGRLVCISIVALVNASDVISDIFTTSEFASLDPSVDMSAVICCFLFLFGFVVFVVYFVKPIWGSTDIDVAFIGLAGVSFVLGALGYAHAVFQVSLAVGGAVYCVFDNAVNIVVAVDTSTIVGAVGVIVGITFVFAGSALDVLLGLAVMASYTCLMVIKYRKEIRKWFTAVSKSSSN